MSDPVNPQTATCKACPSFVPEAQVISVWGRGIGADMCRRYGKVLSKPGNAEQTKALQNHIAGNCSSYMQPTTAEVGYDMTVMLPIPELRDPANIANDRKTACTSCGMCQNLVREVTVAQETGYTTSMCAAKGKLILSNRMVPESRNCEYRQVGTHRATIGGMQFLPEYEQGFGTNQVNVVAAFAASRANFVEPDQYPTDKPVSEGETSAGIRAWRKVVDPDGSGNEVYFPIYDSAYFSDEERALIPKTGSDEHPELYVDHFGGVYGLCVAWLELDETPVFWGMPGVGKTELLRHMAWLMQVPYRRISITASTEVDEIIGMMKFDPARGTYFKYGRLPEAWQRPGVLCIDEPNVAQDPAVWHVFRPLTDNSKQLVIDQNENEILERNPDCYMGMAMNPAWDIRNIGALELADADANRLFHTYIEMPPEALEREIIAERVKLDGWELDRKQMDMVMGIARDVRGLSESKDLPITWAIRQQIKVARALRWFSPITAYKRAAGDGLSPDALQILLDVVRAHWSENVS